MACLPLDYHVHTSLCRHAVGAPMEYALHAQRLGLEGLGFADHLPSRYLPDTLPLEEYAMAPEEISTYVAMVEETRERVPGLTIKMGIEADYYPGALDEIKRLLALMDLDYVYGSVHVLGDWCIDDDRYIHRYQGCDLEALAQSYLDRLIEAVGTGLFDIVTHVDLFKKFGFKVHLPEESVRQLTQAIQDSGMAVEINSNGLRRPCREAFPSERLLKAFCQAGIPIVFGSDAHRPEDVGSRFEDTVALARSAGYTRRAEFSGRKRTLRSL